MSIVSEKFKLSRDITINECHWLDRDFKKDEIVFKCPVHLGGDLSEDFIACSEKDWTSPYFELPKNALEKINENG